MTEINFQKVWQKKRAFLFCLGLIFLLRLPSLFEPYWYGDESIYLALGQAIKKGLLLYRDIHDNKPPLLYLLAALAGNVFWFRTILLGWMMITLVLFAQLSQKLFPKKKNLTTIALLTFTLLSSIPLIEGNIANAEIFMIGMAIAGFYRFLTAQKGSDYLTAGFLFSLASLFKIPAALDFAALLVFSFLTFTSQKRKNFRLLIRQTSLLGLGFLFPFFLTAAYFAFRGALAQFLTAAFSQNIGYLSSWRTGTINSISLSAQKGLFSRGLILGGGLVFLFLKRKKLSPPALLVSVWFLFSLFAALLSERPYPHYLIQVLPAFSLLTGLIFTTESKLTKNLSLFLLALPALAVIIFHFRFYPVWPYYQNFLAYATGFKNRENYLGFFDWRVNRTYRVARFLVERNSSRDKIFIWGDEPSIYALTRLLPVGRYLVAYHIVDFNGYQETIARLTLEPPRYLVWMTSEKRPFPELKAFLKQNYALEEAIGDALIFHRLLKTHEQ